MNNKFISPILKWILMYFYNLWTYRSEHFYTIKWEGLNIRHSFEKLFYQLLLRVITTVDIQRLSYDIAECFRNKFFRFRLMTLDLLWHGALTSTAVVKGCDLGLRNELLLGNQQSDFTDEREERSFNTLRSGQSKLVMEIEKCCNR